MVEVTISFFAVRHAHLVTGISVQGQTRTRWRGCSQVASSTGGNEKVQVAGVDVGHENEVVGLVRPRIGR